MPPKLPNTRVLAAVGASALLCVAAGRSNAMTIVPTFDSSITSMSNASAIQSAFNTVARDYAISFSNPVTVNIGVSWGSVAGQALPSNAVGASSSNLYGYFSYAQVRNDLIMSSRQNSADTSLASAVKALPATAPSGPTQYVIPSAEAKALGLISGNQSAVDGYIGFAGATSNYTFNPLAGVVAGTYDFEAVAAHEIAEVLGRIGGINNPSSNWRTPFDLMRFSAPGVLDFGYSDLAYFSVNGGVTPLKYFNNSSAGGDRTDWLNITGVNDVQDAFISTGTRYSLSAVDLTALDVLGWGGRNLGNSGIATPNATAFALVSGPDSVPEPATWATMMLGFGLMGCTLRQRRIRKPTVNSAL